MIDTFVDFFGPETTEPRTVAACRSSTCSSRPAETHKALPCRPCPPSLPLRTSCPSPPIGPTKENKIHNSMVHKVT